MKRRAISSTRAPAAIGPYSQGVLAAGMLYCSGQIGLDPARGELVEGGVGSQTERALANLQAVLEEAGCSLRDVVRTTVYLLTMEDFAAMNAAYARFFPEAAPARATVAVAGLPRGARVEIDAVAVVP